MILSGEIFALRDLTNFLLSFICDEQMNKKCSTVHVRFLVEIFGYKKAVIIEKKPVYALVKT